MLKDRYFLIVGSLFAGAVGGGFLTKYLREPVAVQTYDLNSDGRMDYVIEERNGDSIVLIQQPDGTYKSIDEHLESQQRRTTAHVEAERSLIEKIVSGLKVEKN